MTYKEKNNAPNNTTVIILKINSFVSMVNKNSGMTSCHISEI